jgi:toxin ParE1/3/4
MNYRVYFISDTEEDLINIYKFIFLNDSKTNAEKLYTKLYNKCLTLYKNADRGRILPELKMLGITDFKEIIYKPYRIIYQVIDNEVFVHCILDGRRDIQILLQERLLN